LQFLVDRDGPRAEILGRFEVVGDVLRNKAASLASLLVTPAIFNVETASS
jgi:hypothetical protein